MKLWKRLVLTTLMICFAKNIFAQQNTADGIVFDADDAIFKGYDKKNQVIELKNKVQIVHQGQYIGCDSATIDTQKTLITCRGHVRLISSEAKMQADEIVLNYKENTGQIKNGFVQVGQVLFEGEYIRKLSAEEYETVSGRYTACTNCPAFWSFKGSKVDAEIGGYAYIKNATIYFGRVPALWFPYLVVPIKSERQTGLLFPKFEFSKSNGFTYQQSFFWAMSESSDSTWTAKNYANRGLKGLVNYRYVLSEDSMGSFDFGFLKDRYFSHNDLKPEYNPTGATIDRWFLKYDHQYYMPYGFIHRMNINTVSDTMYGKDFSQEVAGRGDSSLESRTSLTKNTDLIHWSLDTSYYQGLLYTNPIENNAASVHRFPEMNLSVMPTPVVGNLLFNMDANYVNLVRDSSSYDDLDASHNPIAPDGKYDPATDLIRTGQRLDLQPTLSYPMYYGEAFHFVPSISYRETRYQFPLGADPSASRRYFRANFTVGTNFSRVFADMKNPVADRYKHVILPELNYSVIPWNKQGEHAFFGSKEFEPNYLKDQPVNDNDNIQFDYKDRIFDKNLVTYSLTNKILRKRWLQGSPQYDQVVRYKIWQSYDLYESKRQDQSRHYAWSEISNLLETNFDNFEMNLLLKYYPYQNVTSNATRLRVYNQRKDFAQVTYSQDFLINNGAQFDLSSKTKDITLGGGLNMKYIQFLGSTTYDLTNHVLQSYGYSIRLKPSGDCWALIFSQERLTASKPEMRYNMTFLFDGKTDSGLGDKNRNI